MPTKIAINGFGRIGRCIVRAMAERSVKDLELVAINDLTDAKTLAHLYNYDSVHGRAHAPGEGARGRHRLRRRQDARSSPRRTRPSSRGRSSASTSCIECTGLFTDKEKAEAHLTAGAKKVIISAPAKSHDVTIVLGVNTEAYDAGQAPHHLVRLVHDQLPRARRQGAARHLRHPARPDDDHPLVHERPGRPRHPAPQGRPAPRARRGRQHDPDVAPARPRRCPRSSRALKGKFDGQSIRVPTMDVSIVDLTFETEKPMTKDAIHAAMKAAAEGPMKGILEYVDAAARLGRLHRRPALVDLRRDDDAGDGRQVREGLLLVRQRVGLLEPHGRARAARRRRGSEHGAMPTAPGHPLDPRAARSRTSASSCASTSTSRSTGSTITDDSRIREALPTIKHALERGARVVLREPPRPPEEGPRPEVLARAVRAAPGRAARART